MKSIYKDKYYNHFSKKEDKEVPFLFKDQNFMMRFVTTLPGYIFDENSLTIIYFKKGSGQLCWRDKNAKIDDDKFIIANPSSGWEYINNEEKYIDVLSFAISDHFRKQFNFYVNSPQIQLLDTPFDTLKEEYFFIESPLSTQYYSSGKLLDQIHTISSQAEYEFLSPEELTIEVLQSLYKEQTNGYKIANKIKAKKNSTKLETLKRLLIVRDFIHDNIGDKLSLDLLSNISSLSKFHLYSSFKTVFGKTPHQYINWLRLSKAKHYILKGDFTASEIALILGFSDLPSFSKLFKKAYGVSPSNFNINE
ncbi:helix-turn-helix domain-containing protein [Aquimarina algicola]|uniref:Helix-turn-helix domain-containing protein n=1 Tax=Aquimarina algicola TaxID=2589995 RepID=A0A504IRZ9_9FLAO|nr:helix-turn-helix domain-containing protein [Aquimarina algicola]TPN81247.1 helix-turn-helix domain-containing protein [Aquimarina algicola]